MRGLGFVDMSPDINIRSMSKVLLKRAGLVLEESFFVSITYSIEERLVTFLTIVIVSVSDFVRLCFTVKCQ